MIARTVAVTDPLVRANVFEAFAGPGAPAGVTSCVDRGDSLAIEFDDERTPCELIDALVAVELRYVAARGRIDADLAALAALAANGLNEPGLDRTRIIETYLP